MLEWEFPQFVLSFEAFICFFVASPKVLTSVLNAEVLSNVCKKPRRLTMGSKFGVVIILGCIVGLSVSIPVFASRVTEKPAHPKKIANLPQLANGKSYQEVSAP